MSNEVPEGMKAILVPENTTVLVVEATADGVVTKAADIALMGEEAAIAAAVSAAGA